MFLLRDSQPGHPGHIQAACAQDLKGATASRLLVPSGHHSTSQEVILGQSSFGCASPKQPFLIFFYSPLPFVNNSDPQEDVAPSIVDL